MLRKHLCLHTASRGTANCQLSKPKCITASVYPHITQLLRLAVRPSKTLLLLLVFADSLPRPSVGDDVSISRTPAMPLSRMLSLSTAVSSFLMHSETSWKSSCASWCSRELNRDDDVRGRKPVESGGWGDDRAWIMLWGRRA